MKRVFIRKVITGAAAVCAAAAIYPAAVAETAPGISAEAAILIDAGSGRVLYEKNADAPMKIASTTKILTALIALEHAEPDETVKIKREWTGIEGSSVYLREDEEIPLRDLLYGLMLASGNDAAAAVAGHIADTEFTLLMNEKASALGCENSYFANPHGLDADGHLSSARDLALITRAAMENPLFREIVSTKYHFAQGRSWRNHNRLLWNYDGAIGVKTGYTKSAGRSLVSAAERGGARLICVTLNAPDDWRDHTALFDWAFASYENVTVTPDDPVGAEVRVVSGEKPAVGVRVNGEHNFLARRGGEITFEPNTPPFAYAAIVRGASAGTLIIKCDGEEIGQLPLVYAETVLRDEDEKIDIFDRIKRAWYMSNKYSLYRWYGVM